jgi:hypothetical protein
MIVFTLNSPEVLMKHSKTRLAWFVAAVGVLILTACSSKPATSEAPQPTAMETSVSTQAVYPEPATDQAAAEFAYPIPGAGAGVVPGYPGSGSVFDPGALPYPGIGALPYPVPYVLPGQGAVPYPGTGNVPPVGGNLTPYPPAGSLPAAPTAAPTAANTATPRPTRDILKELHATDPATVKLASGKIQLVEFFAFW